jgi:hypothetical protein
LEQIFLPILMKFGFFGTCFHSMSSLNELMQQRSASNGEEKTQQCSLMLQLDDQRRTMK